MWAVPPLELTTCTRKKDDYILQSTYYNSPGVPNTNASKCHQVTNGRNQDCDTLITDIQVQNIKTLHRDKQEQEHF